MVNHTTVSPSSTTAWPSASQKWDLPVPRWPADAEVLLIAHPLKGFQRTLARP
jgi:hypothetical protein